MQYAIAQNSAKSLKKDHMSNKKTDLLHQIVKLTKQNQYLHTKIDCLYDQLKAMTSLKEKYKKKYKNAQLQNNKNRSATQVEAIPTQRNCGKNKINRLPSTGLEIHDSKTMNQIDDPYTLSKNNESADIQRIIASLSKIDDTINGLNQKIIAINRYIQPQKYQQIWGRIAELSQNLNVLASKLQSRDKSISIKQPVNSQQYGLEQFNRHIPVKQSRQLGLRAGPKLDRFRFIQSRSQRSFESQLLKNGRIRRERIASESSIKKQQWKQVQQIGFKLQKWKFSMSEASRSHLQQLTNN